MNDKRILGAVFSLGLQGRATLKELAGNLGTDKKEASKEARLLIHGGLLKSEGGRLAITEKGRKRIKVVFIGGGFEVIHQGHLYTVDKAKSLGDVLVVAVARDSTIRRRKKRDPIANENQRVRLLSSLRQVDAAILGVEGDIYRTLEKVRPDVVALGYDQYHLESDIKREGSNRGMTLKVVRLDSPYPQVKTSALLKEP